MSRRLDCHGVTPQRRAAPNRCSRKGVIYGSALIGTINLMQHSSCP
jgi:hypothetical protein